MYLVCAYIYFLSGNFLTLQLFLLIFIRGERRLLVKEREREREREM